MKRWRSVDLREQALRAAEAGVGQQEVSRLFGIHRTTLGRWRKRAEQGRLENQALCGRSRLISGEPEAALLRQLEATPDATLEEHVARWQQEQGQIVSVSTMRRSILRLGWTHKKRA